MPLVRTLSPDAQQKLQGYGYPGNVRELQNVVESAYYVSEGETIGAEHLDLPTDALVREPVEEIIVEDFWQSVARPFAQRPDHQAARSNPSSRRGLAETGGNYRKIVRLFKMPDSDYKTVYGFPQTAPM